MCLGIPGHIVSLDATYDKLAMVDVGGVQRQVNISCIVDEAHPPNLVYRRLGAGTCRLCDEPHQ